MAKPQTKSDLTQDEVGFLMQAVANTPIKASDAQAVLVLVEKLKNIGESLSLSESPEKPAKAETGTRTKK